MRFRRYAAALLAAFVLFMAVDRARAQVGAVAPAFSSFTTIAPAVGGVAAASAGLLTFGSNLAAYFNPYTATVAIGAVILGSALIYYDSSSPTGKTALEVSTLPLSSDANPDISSTPSVTPAVAVPALFQFKGFSPVPYLYYDRTACANDPTTCNGSPAYASKMSTQWSAFQSKLATFLRDTYAVELAYAQYWPSASTGNCSSSTTSAQYSGTAGACLYLYFGDNKPASYLANLPTTGAVYTYVGSVYMTQSVLGNAVDCGSTSFYSYIVGNCVAKSPETSEVDGKCRISFSDSGNAVYNPYDPDCSRAKSAGALTPTPGGPSTPPGVTLYDSATGRKVTVERPATTAQGTPGNVTLTEYEPDSTTNTTRKTTVTTAPVAPTAANPAGTPAVTGAGTSVLPGTGANVSPTAASQVVVTNWPATLNVSGSVTCTNCTTTAPAAPVVNVNPVLSLPERMKVDGEVPADAPQALPADQAPATTGLLEPLKAKLTGFFNFQLPSHTSACPSIDLDFHAWGLDVSMSNNFMCDFLEQHRELFQGLMMLVYVAGAILIVLKA